MRDLGDPYERAQLEADLKVLASDVRLRILHELRTPRSLADVRVHSTSPDRTQPVPISRQAVHKHVERLLDRGLVRRVPVIDGDRDVEGGPYRFVVDKERLFALVDMMRGLLRIRPDTVWAGAVDQTMVADGIRPPLPAGERRLVVVYGADDGRSYVLPEEDRPFVLGRGPEVDIHIEHDPYVSTRHAELTHAPGGGHVLRDLGSRNGTFLDHGRVTPGSAVPLQTGAIVELGRTRLVYQGPHAPDGPASFGPR